MADDKKDPWSEHWPSFRGVKIPMESIEPKSRAWVHMEQSRLFLTVYLKPWAPRVEWHDRERPVASVVSAQTAPYPYPKSIQAAFGKSEANKAALTGSIVASTQQAIQRGLVADVITGLYQPTESKSELVADMVKPRIGKVKGTHSPEYRVNGKDVSEAEFNRATSEASRGVRHTGDD